MYVCYGQEVVLQVGIYLYICIYVCTIIGIRGYIIFVHCLHSDNEPQNTNTKLIEFCDKQCTEKAVFIYFNKWKWFMKGNVLYINVYFLNEYISTAICLYT